jgi:hypothetical protein
VAQTWWVPNPGSTGAPCVPSYEVTGDGRIYAGHRTFSFNTPKGFATLKWMTFDNRATVRVSHGTIHGMAAVRVQVVIGPLVQDYFFFASETACLSALETIPFRGD